MSGVVYALKKAKIPKPIIKNILIRSCPNKWYEYFVLARNTYCVNFALNVCGADVHYKKNKIIRLIISEGMFEIFKVANRNNRIVHDDYRSKKYEFINYVCEAIKKDYYDLFIYLMNSHEEYSCHMLNSKEYFLKILKAASNAKSTKFLNYCYDCTNLNDTYNAYPLTALVKAYGDIELFKKICATHDAKVLRLAYQNFPCILSCKYDEIIRSFIEKK